MLGFISSWGVLCSLIKFSGLLLAVGVVASQEVSWGHHDCHLRQLLVSLLRSLCLVSLPKPRISIPIWTRSWGGKQCCCLKMWQKNCSSNLTCLEHISRLKFLTGIREAVESSPALREFHPSQDLWTSYSLSWPQVLWKSALFVYSLTSFADKSQLQSGRATGKHHSALPPSPHSCVFIPTWTCFSVPPFPPPFETQLFFPPAFVYLCTPSTKLLILGNMLCTQKGKETTLFYMWFLPKIRVETGVFSWNFVGVVFVIYSSMCISFLLKDSQVHSKRQLVI